MTPSERAEILELIDQALHGPVRPFDSGVVPYTDIVTTGTTPTTGKTFRLAEYKHARELARPLVLQVDVPSGLGSVNNFFPPQKDTVEMRGTGMVPSAATEGACILLEYGHGAVAKAAYISLASGSVQLPPCSWARAKLFIWGAWSAQVSDGVRAAIVEGVYPQAPPPTLGGMYTFGTAGNTTIYTPRYVRAVDIWAAAASVGTVLKIRLTSDGQQADPLIERNYETGLFVPPWGPVDISHIGGMTLEVSAACRVAFVGYVAL